MEENNKMYYVAVNGQQTGPYSVEQLRMMSLSSQALVWTSGMATWMPLSQIPELQSLAYTLDGQTPPPIGTSSTGGVQPTLGDNRVAAPVENLSLWGYFLKCMHNYTNFKGRARRKEYWGFTLFSTLIVIAVAIMMMMMMSGILVLDDDAMNETAFLVSGGILVLLWLVFLLPSLAVTCRRLHDTGMSGWFYLISFVPYVGGIVLLVWMCMDGRPGTNTYGSDPKGRL